MPPTTTQNQPLATVTIIHIQPNHHWMLYTQPPKLAYNHQNQPTTTTTHQNKPIATTQKNTTTPREREREREREKEREREIGNGLGRRGWVRSTVARRD